MPLPPLTLGYHCSHEQLPPSALLEHVRDAEAAGFTAAMCSDHFHPWSERQGESGFAWSWLGAALAATDRMSFGTVCAPIQRYHPAVIAQAAATLAEMCQDRFWLAIGSGEAVNETITGTGWPDKPSRQARLLESAAIMRALWAGDTVSTRGAIVTEEARLYTRPERPPLLIGAAITPETARWVGSWADGLITVAGQRDKMRAVVDAFQAASGGDKPMFLQVALSFAPTEEEARRAAIEQWAHCALPPGSLADLRTPRDFDRACEGVNPSDVLATVRVSADITRHVDWLAEDASLGFARVYLHNVAREHQRVFIEACGKELLPRLGGR